MKNMSSKFVAAFILGLIVVELSDASGNELYFTKPFAVVVNFVDSVEAGKKDYEKYIDLNGFYEANIFKLEGCDVIAVRKYINNLVLGVPLRHKPPVDVGFVEHNSYKIIEEIKDYRSAIIKFVKITEDVEVNEIKFDLSVTEGSWVITNFTGYFEQYLFKACSAEQR